MSPLATDRKRKRRKPRRESFNDLIKRSSIGAGLQDIKERGIDAHAADLAHEPKRLVDRFGGLGDVLDEAKKHFRGKTKRKGKAGLPGSDQVSSHAEYGGSEIELDGKMTFIGKNRRLSPTFTHWWKGLCSKLSAGPGTRCENPLPNIEAAHKAYLDNQGISVYAARLTKCRLENEAIFVLQNAELQRREAQHSVDLRNKLTGQDPRLKITRDALVSKLLDTARRLDRELAQLRQDLDRLRAFD